jgi:hypothetical protein
LGVSKSEIYEKKWLGPHKKTFLWEDVASSAVAPDEDSVWVVAKSGATIKHTTYHGRPRMIHLPDEDLQELVRARTVTLTLNPRNSRPTQPLPDNCVLALLGHDGLAFWSFLTLVFQFLDETFPDAIETCEETAPHVLVTPEIVARFGVNHREVCVPCGRLLVVIRCGVFGNMTIVNAACLATRQDNVAAFVGVGGEKKY